MNKAQDEDIAQARPESTDTAELEKVKGTDSNSELDGSPIDSTNRDPSAISRVFSKIARGLRWLTKLGLLSGCWLAIGLFLFSFFGRYFFVAELISNFRLQLMFMLGASAIIAMGLSHRMVAGVATVGAVLCLGSMLSFYLPSENPPAGNQKLKLMSYNVLASNFNSKNVVDQIRESDPDVLTVLEYARNWHFALDVLKEKYPYQIRVPRWHGFGVAVFSKYPLSNTKVIQLTKKATDNPFVMTEIELDGQPIRIAAIHVVSPVTSNRMDVRNAQFLEAADLLSADDIPTVVMGDYNCAPWSPYLKDFAKTTGYRETRQSFGPQTTWPAERWWMRIPIDHAYVSDEIHVHKRYSGEAASSDHLPIFLEISIAAEK